MAGNTPLNNQLELNLKHEAAIAHADGEPRRAVSLLINRINETQGFCGLWIWLLVLDLYRVSNSQAPYEKLALHFSQHIGIQAPPWEGRNGGESGHGGSSWRNSLIMEGSPTAVDDEKIRDWILASKETGNSRLDLSRLRLDPSEEIARKEVERMLMIMKRLRRTGTNVLLMGEVDLANRVDRRVESGSQRLEIESAWWELRMEFYQWRGESEQFNNMANLFAQKFALCPVDYDENGAIAVAPGDTLTSPKDIQEDILELPLHVSEAKEILQWATNHWDQQKNAKISLKKCGRINTQAARDIAQLLLAKHGIGAPGGENLEMMPEGSQLILTQCPPLLAALFEATGVSAYATIENRDEKLIRMIEEKSKKTESETK